MCVLCVREEERACNNNVLILFVPMFWTVPYTLSFPSLSLFFSVSFVRSLDSSPTCLLASLATACLLACSLIRSFLTFVCFNYNISNATIMHLLKLTSSTTATATPTVTVTVTGQLR